jgi:hypothetical protein
MHELSMLSDIRSDIKKGCLMYFNCPMKNVSDSIQKWLRKNGYDTKSYSIANSVVDIKNQLATLTPEASKIVLFTIGNNWTIYADNSKLGGIWGGALLCPCEDLKCEGIAIVYREDTKTYYYGIEFHYYNFSNDLPVERNVALYKDSGWKYHESGLPLYFESREAYLHQTTSMKLTPELLNEYAKKLKIFESCDFQHGIPVKQAIAIDITLDDKKKSLGLIEVIKLTLNCFNKH